MRSIEGLYFVVAYFSVNPRFDDREMGVKATDLIRRPSY